MTYLAFFHCYNSSLGKLFYYYYYFTFSELCWQALRTAVLFVLFGGLAAPHWETQPVVCGDLLVFQASLIIGGTGVLSSLTEEPLFL